MSRQILQDPETLLVLGNCAKLSVGLELGLKRAGLGLELETWSWERWRSLNAPEPPSLILPVAYPDAEPTAGAFFEWIRDSAVSSPLLTVLGRDLSDPIRNLALEISDDILFWPAPDEEVSARIQRIMRRPSLNSEPAASRLMQEYCRQQLVGRDRAFRRLVGRLPRVAELDLPVLITGETGTGKELVARAIHHLGPRRRAPFIPVDCPSLPESLFENEIFGHVPGAFTDAKRKQRGLVSLAESGTLFLDEVDTLSLGVQPKLLRFLQESTYRKLGSDRFAKADVRVIAASNSNLEERLSNRQLRADLYYRLSVLRLHLPALRERKADIPLLADHCLAQNQNFARRGLSFSQFSFEKLMSHDWPGNVRELFSVVQGAMVACNGPRILPRHIRFAADSGGPHQELAAEVSFAEAKARSIAEFERRYVGRLLRRHQGNITRAARAAGKERRAFGRLVKKYGLRPGR